MSAIRKISWACGGNRLKDELCPDKPFSEIVDEARQSEYAACGFRYAVYRRRRGKERLAKRIDRNSLPDTRQSVADRGDGDRNLKIQIGQNFVAVRVLRLRCALRAACVGTAIMSYCQQLKQLAELFKADVRKGILS